MNNLQTARAVLSKFLSLSRSSNDSVSSCMAVATFNSAHRRGLTAPTTTCRIFLAFEASRLRPSMSLYASSIDVGLLARNRLTVVSVVTPTSGSNLLNTRYSQRYVLFSTSVKECRNCSSTFGGSSRCFASSLTRSPMTSMISRPIASGFSLPSSSTSTPRLRTSPKP